MTFYTLEKIEPSIVKITFQKEKAENTDIENYLHDLDKIVAKNDKIAFLYHVKVPGYFSTEQRYMIGNWLMKNAEKAKGIFKGTAYLTDFSTHELLIKSIYSFKEPSWPNKFFKESSEAIEWLKQQLYQ